MIDTDKYSWITNEMFDEALYYLIEGLDAKSMLAIPGVYELVREQFNNDVLAKLEEWREEE